VIDELERISEAALESIYGERQIDVAGARCFLYPSLHEGYGFPPLEAMACGTPVVTSATSSLPEVVGDAGVLIESQRPQDVAAGIRRALALGPDANRAARERILTAFPIESRREGILRVVDEAVAGRG